MVPRSRRVLAAFEAAGAPGGRVRPRERRDAFMTTPSSLHNNPIMGVHWRRQQPTLRAAGSRHAACSSRHMVVV